MKLAIAGDAIALAHCECTNLVHINESIDMETAVCPQCNKELLKHARIFDLRKLRDYESGPFSSLTEDAFPKSGRDCPMKLTCPRCHKPTGPEMLPHIKGWYDPSFSCRSCGYHGKLSWRRIESPKPLPESKRK